MFDLFGELHQFLRIGVHLRCVATLRLEMCAAARAMRHRRPPASLVCGKWQGKGKLRYHGHTRSSYDKHVEKQPELLTKLRIGEPTEGIQ